MKSKKCWNIGFKQKSDVFLILFFDWMATHFVKINHWSVKIVKNSNEFLKYILFEKREISLKFIEFSNIFSERNKFEIQGLVEKTNKKLLSFNFHLHFIKFRRNQRFEINLNNF